MVLSWFVILLVIVLIPSACLVAFMRWIKGQQSLKFEEKTRAWEVFICVMSAITVLVGGAMMVGKYVDEQSRPERERLTQAKRESDQRGAEVIRQEAARLQQKHDRTQLLYDEVMSLAVHLASLDGDAVPRSSRVRSAASSSRCTGRSSSASRAGGWSLRW